MQHNATTWATCIRLDGTVASRIETDSLWSSSKQQCKFLLIIIISFCIPPWRNTHMYCNCLSILVFYSLIHLSSLQVQVVTRVLSIYRKRTTGELVKQYLKFSPEESRNHSFIWHEPTMKIVHLWNKYHGYDYCKYLYCSLFVLIQQIFCSNLH